MKSKTFYSMFFLFLAAIYSGIFVLSIFALRDTARQTKEQALNEQYFIAAALYGDMSALETRKIVVKNEMEGLTQPYLRLTESRNAVLAIYQDELLLHATRTLSALESAPSNTVDENRSVTIFRNEGQYFCSVYGTLPEPFHHYSVLYQAEVSEQIQAWQYRNNMMLIAGSVISFILAGILLLLLNKLFRPLSMITRRSREIANGNYTVRLPDSGMDEIAEMARSFNHMAGEIENKITELAAAAENRQRFVDNFAHELRTPLTAIYGYAEYMQKAALEEADVQFSLDAILSESRRMQTMTNALMELSNLRVGEIQMEQVRLPEILNAAKRTLSQKIAEKRIHLQCTSHVESVTGNADLLQSLLVNLIDNAIKASTIEGTVIVRTFLQNELPVLEVSDQGKGMELKELAHITSPYYRVDKSRSRKEGGAGLGLSICQTIAERHNAGLTFQSVPGQGTTVTVTFTTS